METTAAFAGAVPVPMKGRPHVLTSAIRGERNAFAKATPLASMGMPSPQDYLKQKAAATAQSFLTRRAVHTIAYYYTEMHDGPSKQWLLNFDGFLSREKSATFDDKDGEFLTKMVHASPCTGKFVIGHPRGFYKREYEFTIRPTEVADRVLAARKQLAAEWASDLRCIALENKELTRMSLEKLMEPDEKKLDAVRGRVFDYDPFATEQTPLRYKNYNKLKLLVTQQAASRLELELRDSSNHDYMFFQSYVRRSMPIVNDAEFITELCSLPPVSKSNPTYTVNPVMLGRRLMDIRREVADELIHVMTSVPEDHVRWSRQRLEASLSMNPTLGEDYPLPSEAERTSINPSD